MGLFILPKNNLGEESIDDFIETALLNIELFKNNPENEYLLDVFAINNLKRAASLVRKNLNRQTEEDISEDLRTIQDIKLFSNLPKNT